jgi:predicted phosphodiesterase
MMVERIGVIADVHGNALALEAVLRDARDRGIARLVDLGDALYGPLQPLAAYRLFRDAPLVAAVAGNQDRKIFQASGAEVSANRILAMVVEDLGIEPIAWLRARPATAVVDGEVFLCHGSPESDTTYLLEDVTSGHPVMRPEEEIVELLAGVREPVVLCGHSHIPRVIQLANGQLVVNPGSVGLPAYDDDQPVKHFMGTYSPHASYAVLEKHRQGWGVTLHRVVYNWDEAARQARNIGAEDWAQGIATGRMNSSIGPRLAGTTAHSLTY